jgi:hypothetical protein
MQLDGLADFLCPFIWSHVSGLMWICKWSDKRNSIKFCANLRDSATETPPMIRQVFREESMSHTWAFERHVRFGGARERQAGEEQSQRVWSSFSLTSRGLFTKIPPGTTVNSAYYCDCVKFCEDFALNFGDKRTAGCITTHCLTLPFSPMIFFFQKQHVVPQPPHLPVFGPLQLVSVSPDWRWSLPQNTNYRMPLKNGTLLGTDHMRGRWPLRQWWWPVGPKLLPDQMAAPVTEIMDTTSYDKGHFTATINILVVKQWWHLYAWSRESESSSEFSSSLPELPSPVITVPHTISIRRALHSPEHLWGRSQNGQPYKKKLLRVQRHHRHGTPVSRHMLQTMCAQINATNITQTAAHKHLSMQ